MKSLRLQLALWFGISFMVLTAMFMLIAHRVFEAELQQKTWQNNYPEHPDWKIHGSYSEEEVQDIMRELLAVILMGSLPLVGVAMALGYWMARKSLRPIARVNEQLQAKTSANLAEPIKLPEADGEFRDLLRHLNELLARLNASFTEMSEYAAKVAHELRTPLAILRLKVEQAGSRIDVELAEELESELHRLTHVVEQSLLIARAEQGRLSAQQVSCDLAALMREVVEDFQLLASAEGRRLSLEAAQECRITVDPKHLRQIIHNLLTNALKHGQGELRVRVRSGVGRQTLLVGNRAAQFHEVRHETLGLGLRVVEALLRLEENVQFQRRRGKGYHVVRLVFLDTTNRTADGVLGKN